MKKPFNARVQCTGLRRMTRFLFLIAQRDWLRGVNESGIDGNVCLSG